MDIPSCIQNSYKLFIVVTRALQLEDRGVRKRSASYRFYLSFRPNRIHLSQHYRIADCRYRIVRLG